MLRLQITPFSVCVWDLRQRGCALPAHGDTTDSGDNAVCGRGEAVRGRPELYREGRKASTGEERELSLPKGPPEPRESRKGEGEGRDAEGAALEVSELTHPWIYAARPSGESLRVSRAGLGSVLRIC